jgi:ketol-acid reductoisomerase
MMLVPDELAPEVYAREVAESLTPGKYLAFSHGFSIHYKFIEPPADANVFMVAPKGPGHLVRHEYKRGAGVPCLLAVNQDPTGDTKAIGLAYASAIGGGRAGVIETTFREETETDLFGEQAVLCGGLTSLIKAGFETLTEAGYSPEMAYFECLHEMKLIVDLLYEGGISEMRYSISNTAQYGDMTRGPVVVNDETKRRMRSLLDDIQSGTFARDWMAEASNGRQRFQQLDAEAREHPIESVGTRLREMMPWLSKSRLVDKASN